MTSPIGEKPKVVDSHEASTWGSGFQVCIVTSGYSAGCHDLIAAFLAREADTPCNGEGSLGSVPKVHVSRLLDADLLGYLSRPLNPASLEVGFASACTENILGYAWCSELCGTRGNLLSDCENWLVPV